MTTSATGGYLPPLSNPVVLDDAGLSDFFHDWIVGLTGFPGANVRPRWQEEPGNIPTDPSLNWVAFGVAVGDRDVYAAELHHDESGGYNELRRHEKLTLKCSFYGPGARGNAGLMIDAAAVGQNREALTLNSMGLIEWGSIISFPELIRQKWYNRADTSIQIRRQIVRRFGVLPVNTVGIDLDNEHYITHIRTAS